MEKKLTRRESREAAFLTAFAATFEPEEPTVPAEEHAAPDAFANQLLAAMNDHAAELDEIITAHLKGWTLSRVPRVSLVALRLALAEMLYGDEQKPGVAINEAVKLTKSYDDEAAKFVNGILGAFVRGGCEIPPVPVQEAPESLDAEALAADVPEAAQDPAAEAAAGAQGAAE